MNNITLLPIDFNGSDKELSDWCDKWSVEAFGKESIKPERYYKSDENYIYLQEPQNNKEYAIKDRVSWLLCKIRYINRILNGYYPYIPRPTYNEIIEKEEERNKLYKEYQQIINDSLGRDITPQTQQESSLPDKVMKCFKKAIDEGYMVKQGDGYKWLKPKVRLAYLIDKLYGIDEKIPYKQIEELFSITRLDSSIQAIHNAKNEQKWYRDIERLIK